MKDKNIRGVIFEWDDEKNYINKKKHGISFITATNVFFDDKRIEIYDETHSIDEDRYAVIGIVDELLMVVYTIRNDAIRIISARMANKEERKLYYGNNKNYS